VFRVGKDRQVELIDPAPADDRRTAVKAAVKYCPTHALSLDD
jgi:ferredoxin